MPRRILAPLVFALLLFLPLAGAERRIVSLAPGITELVFHLGRGGELVGRTDACDIPAAAKTLPVVGHFGDPDAEKVLALRPTHILAHTLVNPRLTAAFRSAGVRVIVKPCESVADYRAWVELLGKELDAQDAADAEKARVERWLAANAQKTASGKRVLVILWDPPPMGAGAGTLPDEAIRLAGGQNVLGARHGYFNAHYEFLLKTPIDSIVWAADRPFPAEKSVWNSLTEKSGARVWKDFDASSLLRPGPRFFAGVDGLRAFLEKSETKNIPAPSNGALIRTLRLYRLAAAFVIGGALALSGLIFQAILRNPLAEPFTLGLSGGAAVGAALAFITGAFLWNLYTVGAFAFAGALLVLALVLFIGRGGARGAETLLLSGVIAGTIASGILMFLISFASHGELAGITWWMLGDLQGVEPKFLYAEAVLLAVSAVAVQFSAGGINALTLGEAQAWDLGINPKRLTLQLTLLASLLAAGTVAMAGIIGFCGLVIPHAVRRLFGWNHRKIVFPTVFLGGLFLVGCDQLSRLDPIRGMPVGVVTSLIGGPLFLWLLTRRANHA